MAYRNYQNSFKYRHGNSDDTERRDAVQLNVTTVMFNKHKWTHCMIRGGQIATHKSNSRHMIDSIQTKYLQLEETRAVELLAPNNAFFLLNLDQIILWPEFLIIVKKNIR